MALFREKDSKLIIRMRAIHKLLGNIWSRRSFLIRLPSLFCDQSSDPVLLAKISVMKHAGIIRSLYLIGSGLICFSFHICQLKYKMYSTRSYFSLQDEKKKQI